MDRLQLFLNFVSVAGACLCAMPGVARVQETIVGYDQNIWLGEYQDYQDTSLVSTETLGHSSQCQDSVILLPVTGIIDNPSL